MIMVVMVPRESWTDERLDDLNKKVDDGFARLDADIRELRQEVKAQGENLRAEMNERLDSLNRNLLGAVVAIVAAILGSNAF
jgi:hypothetical protein